MKKSTKIIITVSAIASVTAAVAAVSKYFCDFAMGNGKKSFRISAGFRAGESISPEQKANVDIIHGRQEKYREWFVNNSENIYLLTNDGVKVHALLAEQEIHTHRYAVICHGYRDNCEKMGYQAYNFYNMGYNVLAPDGRAAGKTAGTHLGMGGLNAKTFLDT